MPEKDCVSWNAILSAYVEMGHLGFAREFFDEMPERDVESGNFMVSGYVNEGLVDEARVVFDKMLVRNVVSWNVMITGYARGGRFEEVFRLFEEMQKAKVVPDSYTFVNVLSSCSSVGALRQGKWIHGYIDKNGIEVSGFLATALVDMYSKCGCLEKALEVFRSTSKKDISTWNSMIAGFSMHGLGADALEVFDGLVADGFKPNDVTFVNVLSACSRAGMLDEGRKMFNLMTHVYGIQPSVVHYGCITDLLGRFGLLEEAEEFAQKVPFQESQVIWETLLSACRSHGEIDMADRVAMKLLELDPVDSSGYVQLSNIKASTRSFTDAVMVRQKMKVHGATKVPGCSSIELNGTVHEFFSGEGFLSGEGNEV